MALKEPRYSEIGYFEFSFEFIGYESTIAGILRLISSPTKTMQIDIFPPHTPHHMKLRYKHSP
jgi:hypothetical protein